MRHLYTFYGLIIYLFLSVTSSASDIVEISASKDNTLYQSAAGLVSNGAGQHIFAGRTAQFESVSRRRAVFAFDIAAGVPAGSIIENVDLTLHMSRTRSFTSHSLTLHKLLQDWGEGVSDDFAQEGSGTAATVGDATWIHTFFDTDLWMTPGGDFANISASAAVGQFGFYT